MNVSRTKYHRNMPTLATIAIMMLTAPIPRALSIAHVSAVILGMVSPVQVSMEYKF